MATQVAVPQTVNAILLPGWMEENVAVSLLLNDCVFDPPITADEAKAKWKEYNDRVQAIVNRDSASPARLQLSHAERTAANTFLQFHRQRGGAQNIRDVIKIDPLNLVAHQPIVVLDQVVQYRADAASADQYARHSLGIATGAHNLPLQAGLNAIDVNLPHGEFGFIFNQQTGRFEVLELARHISVTDFQGRTLLFAGYHRSYARIERANMDGIDRSLLVALTTDGDFMVSQHSPNQGLRARLCGLRAPLFRDFFDRDFFMAVNLKRKRFVLQVRANVVPVDV